MIYTRAGDKKSINWGAIGKVATLQNIDFSLNTPLNTLYMARDVGWDIPVGETINEPLENAMASDITDMLLNQFEEDGVVVNNVEFDYTDNHEVIPRIEVELEDDEI